MNKTQEAAYATLEQAAEDIEYIREGLEMTFQRELADYLAQITCSIRQSVHVLREEHKPRRTRKPHLAVVN